MGFFFVAVMGKGGSRPPGGAMRFIWAGGIIMPAIVLVGILFYALHVTLRTKAPEHILTIEVVGHQWWWEVRYPELGIVTANEIHMPTGGHVLFKLSAHDVVHSFWVPNLHGKRDMLPGVFTSISMHAREPGVWRGQCGEFCGNQHALMAFDLLAHAPADFDAWVEARQAAASATVQEERTRGKELFFQHGCQNCHAIQGTDAISNIGPDLTHLANRRTLGAAATPNERAMLAQWIVNPRVAKPGNNMPATHLPQDELDALVDYLLSLDQRP
jgi:cytochrome c oxidase subunit II